MSVMSSAFSCFGRSASADGTDTTSADQREQDSTAVGSLVIDPPGLMSPIEASANGTQAALGGPAMSAQGMRDWAEAMVPVRLESDADGAQGSSAPSEHDEYDAYEGCSCLCLTRFVCTCICGCVHCVGD